MRGPLETLTQLHGLHMNVLVVVVGKGIRWLLHGQRLQSTLFTERRRRLTCDNREAEHVR